eukprot:scaffold12565_cov35-Tisochrysis_lutea.AAC.3
MLRKVARPSSRALSIQKAKSINLGMVTMRIATEASPLSLCAVTLCYSTRWCLTADSTRGEDGADLWVCLRVKLGRRGYRG